MRNANALREFHGLGYWNFPQGSLGEVMGDQKQQDKGNWGQRENPQETPRQHSSDKTPAKEQPEKGEELFKKPYSQREFERNPAKH